MATFVLIRFGPKKPQVVSTVTFGIDWRTKTLLNIFYYLVACFHLSLRDGVYDQWYNGHIACPKSQLQYLASSVTARTNASLHPGRYPSIQWRQH